MSGNRIIVLSLILNNFCNKIPGVSNEYTGPLDLVLTGVGCIL